MARERHWVSAGKWMQALRKRRRLSQAAVDHRTQEISERDQNPDLHVSAAYVKNIEQGRNRPGLEPVRSLAEVYRVLRKAVLGKYGLEVDEDEGVLCALRLPDDMVPFSVIVESEKEALAEVLRQCGSNTTRVLSPDEVARVIPKLWIELLARMGKTKLAWVIKGNDEDTMGRYLPPESLVVVDRGDTTIDPGPTWPSDAARPIYLFLLESGYSIYWAYQVGRTITLIPYQPGETRPVKSLKTTKAAVCGRVIHAWRLPVANIKPAASPQKKSTIVSPKKSKIVPNN